MHTAALRLTARHSGAYIQVMERQTCKVCRRIDEFDFRVSDEVWRAVVPLRFRKQVVCLACFDRFAAWKGVDYSSHLRILYFAGDQACLKFKLVSAAPGVASH
jgi:hypothetical protein